MKLLAPPQGAGFVFDEVYHSWGDAPLDEYHGDDGDDSIHAADLGAGRAAAEILAETSLPLLKLAPIPKKRVGIVPFPRTLRVLSPKTRWMNGTDVTAVDRALSFAGVRAWHPPFRKFYGPGIAGDVRTFQKAKKRKATGVYDAQTHHDLAPYFKAFELALMLEAEHDLNPLLKAQRLFSAAAMSAYNNRDRGHYTQGPMRMYLVKHGIKDPALLDAILAWYEDCSSTFTWLNFASGVPDPNDRDYDGLGFTGTLAVSRPGKSKKVFLKDAAAVGSGIFYGGGFPYTHVGGRVGGGRVLSMGGESGPLLLAENYRTINAVYIYKGMGF